VAAFVQELFRFDLYKRSQGKIARQVTFAALALIVALAAWCLNDYYAGKGSEPVWRYAVPLVVLVVGLWSSFRLVQLPGFADFLISVEAEMNKVTWPTWRELVRASIVVILMIFFLAAILFIYDIAWRFLLVDVLHLKQ
jgi:preprotein translocase subunit SecE